jgi:hypothetical protein
MRDIMVLMLIAFISLVHAQDQLSLDSSSTSLLNTSECPYLQYMQYYVMPEGAVPITQISDPTKIDTPGIVPVLNSLKKKAISAQQGANISDENTLWIQGQTDYSQYIIVPKRSIVTLISISPKGGNGILNEISPGGSMRDFAFNFYPQSQLAFYAETIGKYILFTVVDGEVSNSVEIDVVTNCTSKLAIQLVNFDSIELPTRSTDVQRFSTVDTGKDVIRGCKTCS